MHQHRGVQENLDSLFLAWGTDQSGLELKNRKKKN
jgi:hypothetical protein